MNWSQIASTLIFVFGIFIGVEEGIRLAFMRTQGRPIAQVPHLERFANMVVQQVEQENQNLSGQAKKQLALMGMAQLIRDYELPMPSQESISIAVESAVFRLPRGYMPPRNG